MKISACAIVKNEEKNLIKWFANIQNIVDEIVIIDTGSTDRSKEIAVAKGAIVIDFTWENDFAAAKNKALSVASGDWILFLDADEYFSDETMDNVRPYLESINKNQEVQAIFCPLINIDSDNDNTIISNVDSLRIFRHDPRIFFIGAVHENIIFDGGLLKTTPAMAFIEIYHTGYSSSIVQQKLERNLMILLDNIEKRGEIPSDYLYLADCYYGLRDYKKARFYAQCAIDKKVIAIGNETGVFRRLIDSTILSGGSSEDIIAAIDFALIKFPSSAEFHWNKGQYLLEHRDYLRAEMYLKEGLQLFNNAKSQKEKGSLAGRINLLYLGLAKIADLKGEKGKALEYYAISLQYCRYNKFALLGLYEVLREEAAEDVFPLMKSLYMDTHKDLSFVAEVLQVYPADKIYLYYAQLLKSKYNIVPRDLSLGGLFAKKKYEAVVDHTVAGLSDAYLCLLASILRGAQDSFYYMAQTILPPNYMAVIDLIRSESEDKMTDKQKDIYKEVQAFLN